ncbi:MAG: Tat pathway signal sequence domain protein [Opitutaceae bacterium]
MSSLTRRDFVCRTALAALATQLPRTLAAAEDPQSPAPSPTSSAPAAPMVRWLDGRPPALQPGVTWGMPWPRGRHPKETTFTLRESRGTEIALQSWPLAFWPDGSLKWTAHAVPADVQPAADAQLEPGTPSSPAKPLTVRETADAIEIDTGVIVARLARNGAVLVANVQRDGQEILRAGRLVALRQEKVDTGAEPEAQSGEIATATLEQAGPVRAVVRFAGRHAGAEGGRHWLPFVVRLYFYAGGDAIRVVHTFVHDGDERKEFIRGLGLRFEVPLRGELHDRHVRFSGEGTGVFGEAVRTVTGLRRDPGAQVRAAQIAGVATPPVGTWDPRAGKRMHLVPAFADWSLCQSSADGFEIHKRTSTGCSWLTSARGQRAGGLGYIGTPTGGAAVGVRNFWQSYPGELAIVGATGAAAEITAWLWSPRAGAMDLRGYRDGSDMDTYAEQIEGLEITYEDYEPGFDRPEGVARTSELLVWALAATPSRARFAEMAEAVRTPPLLASTPEYLHACEVFGGLWAPVDRSSRSRAAVEERLDWAFRFYEGQREQRRWYGFWNFGDVMHTYDTDRHEWRYDVGGFAWDNSELSTDIWLWLHFLRTGRADVFRFAEAMTRHTGEVDVHHLGRFAPLGSRHNVLHWGCSAKQLRISTATNRRYFYYLTGDERVGELLREQVEAVRALATVQANRKVAPDRVTAPDPDAKEVYAGFGTDWGSAAAAWLTEWERTGDPKMRDRLLASMRTIGGQPRGFFTGGARLELATGAFAPASDNRIMVSHLSAVFGLVEVCAELVQLLDEPSFRRAWLDYCALYNAPAAEQEKQLGEALRGNNLRQAHSRLTAFAARTRGDATLAQRAWREFFEGERGDSGLSRMPEVRRIDGPEVLRSVDEAAWVSTNGTAQWGLAAIQCLALVGDSIPEAGR